MEERWWLGPRMVSVKMVRRGRFGGVLEVAVILNGVMIHRIHNSLRYASKFGKLSSGHRTGKGQFSFQSRRKAMPKNAQTTAQLHSSHMLVK